MKLPEIRIRFGWLLYEAESRELAEKHNLKLEEPKFYLEKTYSYWKEWEKRGEKILAAMQDALGVGFYMPVINVDCVPYFIPKSGPVIMNFRHEPDQFVDVLTHELCHVLLTDNNIYQEYKEAPKHFISADWKKLFGDDHEHAMLVHIPVHAICKYIWTDVLHEPERIERDKQEIKTYVGSQHYVDAWEYVDAHDYKQIIADLKQSYAEMKA